MNTAAIHIIIGTGSINNSKKLSHLGIFFSEFIRTIFFKQISSLDLSYPNYTYIYIYICIIFINKQNDNDYDESFDEEY